jgi:hypothetical protein
VFSLRCGVVVVGVVLGCIYLMYLLQVARVWERNGCMDGWSEGKGEWEWEWEKESGRVFFLFHPKYGLMALAWLLLLLLCLVACLNGCLLGCLVEVIVIPPLLFFFLLASFSIQFGAFAFAFVWF